MNQYYIYQYIIAHRVSLAILHLRFCSMFKSNPSTILSIHKKSFTILKRNYCFLARVHFDFTKKLIKHYFHFTESKTRTWKKKTVYLKKPTHYLLYVILGTNRYNSLVSVQKAYKKMVLYCVCSHQRSAQGQTSLGWERVQGLGGT